MPSWIEYKVVSEYFLEKLEFEVNRHIRLGYIPLGGISCTEESQYSQAMTIDRETAITRTPNIAKP